MGQAIYEVVKGLMQSQEKEDKKINIRLEDGAWERESEVSRTKGNDQILTFVTYFVQIASNPKYTGSKKLGELEKLMQRYGITDRQLLQELGGKVLGTLSFDGSEGSDIPRSENISEYQ